MLHANEERDAMHRWTSPKISGGTERLVCEVHGVDALTSINLPGHVKGSHGSTRPTLAQTQKP